LTHNDLNVKEHSKNGVLFSFFAVFSLNILSSTMPEKPKIKHGAKRHAMFFMQNLPENPSTWCL
jgi:hypothetical protein